MTMMDGTTTATLLTVVVPTIPGREQLLARCLASILDQSPPEVEVIVVDGNGPLGSKVTMATEYATGAYLTVVDDDDWLADDYMAKVLPQCRTGVDFVGIQIQQLKDGRDNGISETRGDHVGFGKLKHGPTPKGVTKSSLWRSHRLRNFYTADRAWCLEVGPEVKSHAFVDSPVYIYDWWGSTSAFIGERQGREVGAYSFDSSRIVRLTL